MEVTACITRTSRGPSAGNRGTPIGPVDSARRSSSPVSAIRSRWIGLVAGTGGGGLCAQPRIVVCDAGNGGLGLRRADAVGHIGDDASARAQSTRAPERGGGRPAPVRRDACPVVRAGPSHSAVARSVPAVQSAQPAGTGGRAIPAAGGRLGRVLALHDGHRAVQLVAATPALVPVLA